MGLESRGPSDGAAPRIDISPAGLSAHTPFGRWSRDRLVLVRTDAGICRRRRDHCDDDRRCARYALELPDLPGAPRTPCVSIVPIAAPPAFWWIGATRMTLAWGNANGPGPAAVVAGLALSPVTLLLVFAALRQMPSNLYESARVVLSPAARVYGVLLPLLRAPLDRLRACRRSTSV